MWIKKTTTLPLSNCYTFDLKTIPHLRKVPYVGKCLKESLLTHKAYVGFKPQFKMRSVLTIFVLCTRLHREAKDVNPNPVIRDFSMLIPGWLTCLWWYVTIFILLARGYSDRLQVLKLYMKYSDWSPQHLWVVQLGERDMRSYMTVYMDFDMPKMYTRHQNSTWYHHKSVNQPASPNSIWKSFYWIVQIYLMKSKQNFECTSDAPYVPL